MRSYFQGLLSGPGEPSAKICLIEKPMKMIPVTIIFKVKLTRDFRTWEAPVELTAQTIDFEAAENNPSKVLNKCLNQYYRMSLPNVGGW